MYVKSVGSQNLACDKWSLARELGASPPNSTSWGQESKEKRKVFDNMGQLTSMTVYAKIFLQELWNIDLDWDEVIDEKLEKRGSCSTQYYLYYRTFKSQNIYCVLTP